ncbi:uroporphyrinogen decarboxylase family protein [Paenibacillus sp. tmac-D7]|uniref:uroporphyrinogen decarboxylase family protein n=1 Tax=Paenibacillus sp. tmac-D7 TaxID=2591462 RepID=UPI0011429C58|nr:uroporphyrinogen decarboxylase family protein [Paenibacillus sp. tmac-D7]
MNVKELVKNALRCRKVPRPPFIPLIGSYLTRVDQYSLKETWSDPGLLHQALRNTQQLLNYDAVVMPLDTSLEAEAFGLPVRWDGGKPEIGGRLSREEPPPFDSEAWLGRGRVPVFIEAATRYAQVEGKQIPLFASVSGPLSVWSGLYGRQAGSDEGADLSDLPHLETVVQAVIALCREYAEAGVDGIIVNEGSSGASQESLVALSGVYKPIFNVIRHFNLPGVLRSPQQTEGNRFPFTSLGADACICSLHPHSGGENIRGAIGIPLKQDFWSEASDSLPIVGFGSAFKNKGVFLTTESPLDQEDIDLLDLQDRIEQLLTDAYWNG